MNLTDSVSPQWIEAQYRLWQTDPGQMAAEWSAYFQGFDLGQESPACRRSAGGCLDRTMALKMAAVQTLIYRYRDLGHLLACTDPLSPCRSNHPLLDLPAFGLGAADLEITFHLDDVSLGTARLREILALLQETYCRSIGVEFMHLQEPAERQWLLARMEKVRNRPPFSRQEQAGILRRLFEAAQFEAFLHRRFVGQKRFSLEGGEVLIPLLDAVIRHLAEQGVTDLVFGMAHRGRLNVLANIFGKPLENIFAEFEDNRQFGVVGEGDVKYHQGLSGAAEIGDKQVRLTLLFNPSHLEAVDPVVEGKSRARQDGYGADGWKRVVPVLIHGDAAFAGQGMVAETLNLSQLDGYRSGGTLHLVLNNQIGFTTAPADARSTLYATDVAKMLMVPIFHVHGEDPEAVVHAARLACDYRQTFGRDVVLEVLCYRRHGHNEGDEPYFTQPLMYAKIKDRLPVQRLYAERLQQQGWEEEGIEEVAAAIEQRLEGALGQPWREVDAGYRDKWRAIQTEVRRQRVATAVASDRLQALGQVLTALPEGFVPHPKIAALLKRRREAFSGAQGLDWALGEALAFASLLAEGISVRLSGQDSRRGTFSQRHAALFDVTSGATHVPLAATAAEGARFEAFDSMLSEAAVLGFEYGYSLESPQPLILWEAQFGDFANGAQVIIDQFIAGSQAKWGRASGLVLLLPHGYEGQGPEHSSARIERFLQLCAEGNLQIATPSTPAQLFHLLRRQVLQTFRRPLVVFTPKSLLRHGECVSDLEALTTGTFAGILADGGGGEVGTVLLCSGKIYYQLREVRRTGKRGDVALVRIEQLYPFDEALLAQILEPWRHAGRFVWVQEEPANGGAWSYLRPLLTRVLGVEPEYIGREAAAAPATGSHRRHMQEQAEIVARALG